ncbi:MAG: RNA polymerase factor sigma-54 [Burkholderiaceae bacterium]
MTLPALKLATQHTQTMTPRLQYAVRLLQMSALDYEQELHGIVGKNPFLEVKDPPPERSTTGLDTAPGASMETGAANAAAQSGDDTANDEHASAWEMMVAEVDLRQHLRGSANLLKHSQRDHALVCALIESLDDDGYLRLDLAEVASLTGLDPPADASEVNMALRLVQSFEPAGVAARSVCECLLLQLEKIAPDLRELCRAIVSDHVDRLAQRDAAGLARLMGRTPAEINAACTALRRLDPHPGWRFGKPDVLFIKPDVVARKVRGKWVAQLNPAVVPRLKLNQAYADLFQSHRETRHGEMGAHLQEARWTLRNVEQRCSTILAVAQAILQHQQGFFQHGPLAMKPLALRDIAEEVGVHESTVCRVTNNKYIATPNGLMELKTFFSRAMPMSTGGGCSPTAIRGLVEEIILSESPSTPLSDVQIAERLARQGLSVARRTVTKYRQMLKIAPVERRRVHDGDAAGSAGSALRFRAVMTAGQCTLAAAGARS